MLRFVACLLVLALLDLSSAQCPAQCICGDDNNIVGGSFVACMDVSTVPVFPANTTTIVLQMRNYTGLPAGAIRDLHLCEVSIGGEVGDVKAGAISNIRANPGCNMEPNFTFMDADLYTLEEGAINGVHDFSLFHFLRRRIRRLNKRSLQNFTNIQTFRMLLYTIDYLDDEVFYQFADIEMFEFDKVTIDDYNVGNHGPFLAFRNITTMRMESLMSDGFYSEFIISSYLFSGLGSAVSHIQIIEFDIPLIEENSFAGLTNVTSILFENCDIMNVSTGAFAFIDGVESITFRGSNRLDDVKVTFDKNAFTGLSNVGLLKFDDAEPVLAEAMFAGVTNLRRLEFQETLFRTSGHEDAFDDLDVDEFIVECSQLPGEDEPVWRFRGVKRIDALMFEYRKCPGQGNLYAGPGMFTGVSGNIGKMHFNYLKVKKISRNAFSSMMNVEEIIFDRSDIDVCEPSGFSRISRVQSMEFRHLKWDVFYSQTFRDMDNINLFSFDDVDLGEETAILPPDTFYDMDTIGTLRFNDFNTRYFSTRAFGWSGSSKAIDLFQVTNSTMYMLMSHAFPGLAEVGTFQFTGNIVNCMETGSFMGMKGVNNVVIEDNMMPCPPIFETPTNGDWRDSMICLGQTPCPDPSVVLN